MASELESLAAQSEAQAAENKKEEDLSDYTRALAAENIYRRSAFDIQALEEGASPVYTNLDQLKNRYENQKETARREREWCEGHNQKGSAEWHSADARIDALDKVIKVIS